MMLICCKVVEVASVLAPMVVISLRVTAVMWVASILLLRHDAP